MIRVPFYHIAAFVDGVKPPFTGNAAAVVLCPRPLSAAAMQATACEFALSETAFVVPREGGDFALSTAFNLKWFTPLKEVPMCGHGSLAAAHALAAAGNLARELTFSTLSGVLTATRADNNDHAPDADAPRRSTSWTLSLPAAELVYSNECIPGGVHADPFISSFQDEPDTPADASIAALLSALWPGQPFSAFHGFDFTFCKRSRKLLIDLGGSSRANPALLAASPTTNSLLNADQSASSAGGRVAGICLISKQFDKDIIEAVQYRYFSPWNGLPGVGGEDPVNGSSLALVGPHVFRTGFNKSHKPTLRVEALSLRGGIAVLTLEGDVVKVTGAAQTVVAGEAWLPQ